MRSSTTSYDCRIEQGPHPADRWLHGLAALTAMAGIGMSGLDLTSKIGAMLAFLVAAVLHWRGRQRQRVEWRLSRHALIRLRFNCDIAALPDFFEVPHLECIGPWVLLRGRVDGRLQYGLIWPWQCDAESHRRLRRLASLMHTGPTTEASA